MNATLRIWFLVALMIYFICVFYLLKKRRLELKYTLLWLFSGTVMLLVVLFPSPFERILSSIGVLELTNGLFALVLFLFLIIFISMTAVLSELNNKFRTLSQKFALCEKKVRDLEREYIEIVHKEK